MAMRRDPTGPSQATIKRLFAHSGNRCAFPRCMEVLVEEGTVVGKVCHIKAANPKGPRYDPQQTTAERHGYGNLVLLCGKHHTVIDDDEESYTVERLIKMKADHQSRTRRVDEAFAERAVQILVNQPVISMNQSGGIAAHTINAGTINLHSPSVPESPHDSWQLRPTAKGASSFIDDGRILCHPRSLFGAEPVLAIIWYNYPQFFMRIIPSTPPPKPWSRTEVKAMIDRARLTPLPHYYELYFSTTNEFGAVVLNCRNVEAQNS